MNWTNELRPIGSPNHNITLVDQRPRKMRTI